MEPNIRSNVNGMMPFLLKGSNLFSNIPNAGMENGAEMNNTDMASEAEKNREMMNRERIRKAILGDIQRANDFYTSKVEPVLRQRHQIYEADRAYYRKRFPEVSK